MTFHVLLYDTYCITVPTKWIDFERSTFQMPRKCKQLTQACVKEWPPCDDWDEVTFQKSFGPYETYKNARSVEKAISDMSGSDDNIIKQTNTEKQSTKRLIKKRKFFNESSSDDEMPQTVESLKKKSKPVILSNVEISAGPSTNNLIDKIHCLHETNSAENNYVNNREYLENQSIHTEHTYCCEKCRQGYFLKFAILERKINRIIHFLENSKEVQNEVKRVDFSLLPNFPLTMIEQVEAFNNQLEDNNVRRQFIEKMSQVGGETVPKNVRNIMSQIIGHQVAQAYTWTGQKKKLSLRKSKLSDSVIEVVL